LERLIGEKGARKFAVLMLKDVLDVLAHAGLERDTYVITSDDFAKSVAKSFGAGVVPETQDRGVNEAVSVALQKLSRKEAFVILPADLPLLAPGEIMGVLSLLEAGFIVIAPSAKFDGTNALAFTREAQLPLSYDSDSFWNHLAGVSKLAKRVAVPTSTGLIGDIDSPSDFRFLAGARINRRAVRFAKRAVSRWGSSSRTAK